MVYTRVYVRTHSREYVYTCILMYTSRVGGSTYVEYPHIRNVMYTRRYIHTHSREWDTHVYVVLHVCYYTRSGMYYIRYIRSTMVYTYIVGTTY